MGAPHSITSSARASMVGAISRPMAFAVLRLITISNFVGCSTGRSAGFAPRTILWAFQQALALSGWIIGSQTATPSIAGTRPDNVTGK